MVLILTGCRFASSADRGGARNAAGRPRRTELKRRRTPVTTGRLVMDIPETGVMRVLYNQHGAALWHYACRLTSNATRAEDVVQETLLRAGQHPQMVDGNERSARSWLFTVAREMLSSNGSGTPQGGGGPPHQPRRGRGPG